MGRPIAGQYRVPLRGQSGWATIDAEDMTVRVGHQVFGVPEIINARPMFVRLTREAFWRILDRSEPVSVEPWLAHAHINLRHLYLGRRIIRLSLLDGDN